MVSHARAVSPCRPPHVLLMPCSRLTRAQAAGCVDDLRVDVLRALRLLQQLRGEVTQWALSMLQGRPLAGRRRVLFGGRLTESMRCKRAANSQVGEPGPATAGIRSAERGLVSHTLERTRRDSLSGRAAALWARRGLARSTVGVPRTCREGRPRAVSAPPPLQSSAPMVIKSRKTGSHSAAKVWPDAERGGGVAPCAAVRSQQRKGTTGCARGLPPPPLAAAQTTEKGVGTEDKPVLAARGCSRWALTMRLLLRWRKPFRELAGRAGGLAGESCRLAARAARGAQPLGSSTRAAVNQSPPLATNPRGCLRNAAAPRSPAAQPLTSANQTCAVCAATRRTCRHPATAPRTGGQGRRPGTAPWHS